MSRLLVRGACRVITRDLAFPVLATWLKIFNIEINRTAGLVPAVFCKKTFLLPNIPLLDYSPYNWNPRPQEDQGKKPWTNTVPPA